ncbi:probable ubiquitin carboxyl-terminal hydrolase MINDY-4 isoform X2 [Erinaceus europaeus]|uniref:Ubiquitin carboxyl-terminal hydrolase MINDY n=1 Tax=Erinaceus europaeus TaxID=9365 RepID=A0ABM3XSI2_ERIEU|nr:probable ubiquitin carboxyl-terminal hydrolase MINDY-4 isoform X2 [Erinaceus europaeus]
MDAVFVEEVAASLVREFLSRKGLKKTCATMDQERPRSDLSVNSRNDLRKLLHLEFLYKENKAKENPLKTNLELITRYFLDLCGNTANNVAREAAIPELLVPKKSGQVPLSCSEATLVNIYDLGDEDAGWRARSGPGRARQDSLAGDVAGNFASSRRRSPQRKPGQSGPCENLPLAPTREKTDESLSSELSSDSKRATEKRRPRSGLLARGMMARPTANSPQDSHRRRGLRCSLAPSSVLQPQEEEGQSAPELCARTPAGPGLPPSLALSGASSPRSPGGPLVEPTSDKPGTLPGGPPPLPSRGPSPWERGRWSDLPEESSEASRAPLRVLPSGDGRTNQERLERAFRRQGGQPLPLRKHESPVPSKAASQPDVLLLEDVEDEVTREDAVLSPPLLSVLKPQAASRPMDLSVAKDIKNLLFGSSFCCFSEEWRRQSFPFSEAASLKYGIVQHKGGPCGVLAAVQGCVLQKLLFDGDSTVDCVRQLQPSNSRRTHCLALAIADIVWRAGGQQRAVITLSSGTQQFSPTGKYKADGVLETLTLHSLTCYEELVAFLQQSIRQFEVGPYGCILLTLSAILSRTTELVRQDFDVPTSHLIGAHGYCTQELVNLLLTGRAVSNVFNDTVELNSGDGSVTLLKGITARSDVGFLSLFEHYDVCQVGCFLKTPRFPIWVVCSESHFSVLFSLQPELLRDWRAERFFDLYYYDGLANQQEQIRLTVDTTQIAPENRSRELVPPLELCIRTKWKGASVDWNGSDPIL